MRPDKATIDEFIASEGYWFRELPPTHLECCICQGILQNPVCCPTGAHTFCKRCVVKSANSGFARCPLDKTAFVGGTVGLRRAPAALQDCIDVCAVRCSLGCGWTGRLSLWSDHIRHDCSDAINRITLEALCSKASLVTAAPIKEAKDNADISGHKAETPHQESVQPSAKIVALLQEEMKNILLIAREEMLVIREKLRDRLLEDLQVSNTQQNRPKPMQHSQRKAASRLAWQCPVSDTAATQATRNAAGSGNLSSVLSWRQCVATQHPNPIAQTPPSHVADGMPRSPRLSNSAWPSLVDGDW